MSLQAMCQLQRRHGKVEACGPRRAGEIAGTTANKQFLEKGSQIAEPQGRRAGGVVCSGCGDAGNARIGRSAAWRNRHAPVTREHERSR
jgi:hypothetical protein